MTTQMIKNAFPNDLIIGEEDQAESAAGKQDELFPTGRIWCGELLQLCACVSISYEELSHVYMYATTLCFLQNCKQLLSLTIIKVDPIDGTTNFVHNVSYLYYMHCKYTQETNQYI